ncbi:MAG: hypothetical protein NTX03_14335 [Bacteroidetes bacterium]|nr:hypothetical protein [Bacteroidota bacterium]
MKTIFTILLVAIIYCLSSKTIAKGSLRFAQLPQDSPIVDETPNSWVFTYAQGLNIGYFEEKNAASGTDAHNLSGAASVDLGMNFKKEGVRFAMTNEAHWLINIQKDGFTSQEHFKRINDDLKTLHDFSYAMSDHTKWNFNLIAKVGTATITYYNGNYFQAYDTLGAIGGFFNPYDVTLSPGFKFAPDNYFRLSISPYSVNLYGLLDQDIANTGRYTQEHDSNGKYVTYVKKPLGAELNIWYDRVLFERVEMQYRIGVSSNYFTGIGKNALLDGLFITRIKIIEDLYLSHRGVVTGELTQKPFKPYVANTILLTYSQTF